MRFNILSPEDVKKAAQAKFKEWQMRKEKAEKAGITHGEGDGRAGSTGDKGKAKPRPNLTKEQVRLNQGLLRAAEHRELIDVKQALASGADIEAKYMGGRTPLMYAVRRGDMRMADFLISRGADLNARDRQGWTPLIMAADSGNIEMIRLLLSGGARINDQREGSITALAHALKRGKVEAVEFLLSRGADVKPPGAECSALLEAAEHCSLKVVQMLISRGADIHAKRVGNVEMPEDAEGETTRGWGWEKKCALERAQRGEVKVKKTGELRKASENALTRALTGGKAQTAEFLISNDVEILDGAVMLACENCPVRIVSLLMSKGMVADEVCLRKAAEKGRTETVKLLISQGLDVNSKTENNFTALMLAASGTHAGTVELLIANGADVNARDCNDHSALHHTLTYELLSSSKTDHLAGRIDRTVRMIQALSSAGADLNATEHYGKTALSEIAWRGDRECLVEIAECLISLGANVNAKNKDGETALSTAIRNKAHRLADLLRKHGARE